MTELPGWLQETRDRADKATRGPWYLVNCDDRDFASMLRVTTAADSERPEDTVAIILLQNPLEACVADERWDENGEFIARARVDVPRLIEMVADMAGVLETARELLGASMEAALATRNMLLFGHLDAACSRIGSSLTKYRGEEDKP